MSKQILKSLTLLILTSLLSTSSFAQLPTPAIVGYWQNWQANDFIRLRDIDPCYNVIDIAFAVPRTGGDYDMMFKLANAYTVNSFKSEMGDLQAAGKKVIISIGGANDPVNINSEAEKNTFVSSMSNILDEWGFDGLDIDLEGSSLEFQNIRVTNNTDPKLNYLIQGIREVIDNYKSTHGRKLILTMAPETVYVQGGLSQWAGTYRGAYLPLLEAFKDDIDLLHVQLYNSGDMFGLDGAGGGAFQQGTVDFIISQTEAAIRGFTCAGNIGTYSGLPASKVAIGLPACSGSGYINYTSLKSAIEYLMGNGPQPGSYTLKQAGGYPDLRGMMTWSLNRDALCNPAYGYCSTWDDIFDPQPDGVESNDYNEIIDLYPNPSKDELNINLANNELIGSTLQVLDLSGKVVYSELVTQEKQIINVSALSNGFYTIKIGSSTSKFIKQ